ncbi:DUF3159 domain-containing protein [Rothia sp. ZJ932]|uniref:DUF3159 domain-containing protein n=1 Tax=Rothia sp. ZJ932 TaxID=2810516 RepID=UPI0019680ECF|nr:DUF3159 domain-containing protein [Rothia sp. ZJ932]QRZ60882.1 DUF3159 domain-containing protein [Rothia sp. ZJ932]
MQPESQNQPAAAPSVEKGSGLNFAPPKNIRRTANGDVDVLYAVGGVRGIIEAIAPGFLFLTAFLITSNLLLAASIAAAVTLVFGAVRLVQRGSLMQSLSGLIGVALCAAVALRSGEAADFYVPGLWINAAYAVGIAGLLLFFKLPVVGFIYSFFRGEQETWRSDPRRVRAYTLATLVLIGMFVLRLAVQVPLYLADQVGALGTARLVMGTPLYAAVIWLTWLMTAPRTADKTPTS